MSKKKSGKQQTDPTKIILLATAILNLIRTIVDMIKTIIE